MPKEGLKEKLDGNELDLSLCELTSVPVKELVCPILFKHANGNPGHAHGMSRMIMNLNRSILSY